MVVVCFIGFNSRLWDIYLRIYFVCNYGNNTIGERPRDIGRKL